MHEAEADGPHALPVSDDISARAETIAASERPWLFGFLIAPSAVVANGVVQGGLLAFLLRAQGIGVGRSSQILWLLTLPTTIYFLWSPLTDFLVRRRTWLLIGTAAAGVFMALAFRAKNLAAPGTITLMFLSACSVQLVVSSCGGMMGAMRSERSKRVAGSAYQGGSLAFGAVAVFVLILLAQRTSHTVLAAVMATLIVAPGLLALLAPPQDLVAESTFADTMRRVWTEFKATFLRWRALPYTLVMLFPMTTGAAVGLLPGVAQDYGLSGPQVAWMNGLAGALLMAAGSFAALLIPGRIRASVAYLSVALVNASTLLILCLGPQRPGTYVLGITLYLFTVGTGFALFTAVVLEFLGRSGKSGSGRYSIINSLGNVPVVYMTALDGWGGARWGPRGVSATEAVVAGLGATILLAWFLSRRPAASGEQA
jgi:PAT family beta-lactamase induction signal transducer AmpG